MNEQTEKEALNEIFEEVELAEGEDLLDAFSDQEEMGDLERLQEELQAQESSEEFFDPTDEEGFGLEGGENPLQALFDSDLDEEIPDVGFNWPAVIFSILLVSAVAGFLLNTFRTSRIEQAQTAVENSAREIQSDVQDIAYQTLLFISGNTESHERLSALRGNVDGNVTVLSEAATNPAAGEVFPGLEVSADAVSNQWLQLGSQVDLVAGNRGVIDNTMAQVKVINSLTPTLLNQSDKLVDRLISSEAPLNLINAGSSQRFLRIGGVDVNSDVSNIDRSYRQLRASADSIVANVDQYSTVLESSDQIQSVSAQLQGTIGSILNRTDGGSRAAKGGILDYLPQILAGLGLFALLGLIWSLLRQNSKQEHINNLRTKRSEDAVIKLLDEMGDLAQGDLTVEAEVTNEVTGAIADSVNFAIGEMRILVNGIKTASNEMSSSTEDSEELIAQLLTSNDAQSEEILNAAQEIEEMSDTMERMSGSALQSSERARVTAESAKQGAAAVRDTILGMNSTRNQIQDTAKRLKRLGESSQQINEIVNLIQDVTEQTNVLSLNASIQAAMAGEAGRGFAVVAEEVQRLADRSARASSEITDLVKNIQQDANNAITSMETTTEEVITGAKMADEAGQALDEIEQISQELYDAIERVASEATQESEIAKTVSARMNTLKSATEQADLSVSQVAAALGQVRDVVDKLDRSVAGFQLPG